MILFFFFWLTKTYKTSFTFNKKKIFVQSYLYVYIYRGIFFGKGINPFRWLEFPLDLLAAAIFFALKLNTQQKKKVNLFVEFRR